MQAAALAGAGLVAACAALARVPNLAQAPVTFLLLFAGAFACYALGAWGLHESRGGRAMLLVLLVAGAARLALLPAAPTLSTDAYRYVWDARVASAGISPYLHWFTALKANIDEIAGLVPLASRVGAEGVNLQRLVYNGLGLATAEQSLHGRLVEREEAVIQHAAAAARGAGIVFSASGAVAPEVSLNPAQEDRPWSACRRPWSLVYVTVHGNVLPCCIAPWITAHYDGIVLGNLFRQSLAEIWWGPRYLEFRDAIQTEAPPEPCRGCGVKWSL